MTKPNAKPWHHEDSRQHEIFDLLVERTNGIGPDAVGLFAVDIAAAMQTTVEAITYALKRLIDTGRAKRTSAVIVSKGRHAWMYWPVTPFDASAWPDWASVAVREDYLTFAHRAISVHKCMSMPDDDEPDHYRKVPQCRTVALAERAS